MMLGWTAVRCGVRAGVPAPIARSRSRPQAQFSPSPRSLVPSRAFNDGGIEAEPEEQELEELIRAEKNKQKAIKFRRIQAEFGCRGAPPRTLTTEALQQIRFLKARFPEEWTVSQLAEGFSVSEDVIRRVLRSKFIPSPERRRKQDAKVAAAMLPLSHRTEQPTVSLPGPSDPGRSKLVTDQPSVPRLSQGAVTLPVLPDTRTREEEVGESKPIQQRSCTDLTDQGVMKVKRQRREAARKERDGRRETSDMSDVEQLPAGGILDEELEKFTAGRWGNQMNIVQRGHEFYDQEGNFLYRINEHLTNPKQES
ncbi:neugrin isoform X1 [Mobula hypostoma]|uniref:neugrin isoform X1 n=1 Tax=Mobula hypostoma TaxID=723540 RepID=UPI002FC309D6